MIHSQVTFEHIFEKKKNFLAGLTWVSLEAKKGPTSITPCRFKRTTVYFPSSSSPRFGSLQKGSSHNITKEKVLRHAPGDPVAGKTPPKALPTVQQPQ